MKTRTFVLLAAVIFLLIAVGHFLRITLGIEWLVAGKTLPMWTSGAGMLVSAFLAYQGLRLGRIRKTESGNVTTFRGMLTDYSHGDFDPVISRFADNLIYQHYPRGETFRNHEQLRQWLTDTAATFPDSQFTDLRFLDGGDSVVAQYTFTATDKGGFGGIAPTGRRVSGPVCEVYRFDERGRVVSGEMYFDLYALLVQLGHSPAPSAAVSSHSKASEVNDVQHTGVA